MIKINTVALTEREKVIMYISMGHPTTNNLVTALQYDVNDDGSRTCIAEFEDNTYYDYSDVFTLAFGRRLIDDFLEYPEPSLKLIPVKSTKRTEWMEGFLWAEEGFKILGASWLEDYVGRCCDPKEFESDRGVYDYYMHIRNLMNEI